MTCKGPAPAAVAARNIASQRNDAWPKSSPEPFRHVRMVAPIGALLIDPRKEHTVQLEFVE